jgi:hypothetical protein
VSQRQDELAALGAMDAVDPALEAEDAGREGTVARGQQLAGEPISERTHGPAPV